MHAQISLILHWGSFTVPARGMSSNFSRVGKKILVCAITILSDISVHCYVTQVSFIVSVGKQCRFTFKENLLITNRED